MASVARDESEEGSSQRRERAAIAAQACQTCRNRCERTHSSVESPLTKRNRKSKCDEQRPKCQYKLHVRIMHTWYINFEQVDFVHALMLNVSIESRYQQSKLYMREVCSEDQSDSLFHANSDEQEG